MATVRGHGGSCCGVFHISGMSAFAAMTPEQCRAQLERDLRQSLWQGNSNRVAEITMTDNQCQAYPALLIAMGQLGFKVVNRFRNSNSGNIVNIFHRIEVSEGVSSFPFTMGEPGEDVVCYRRVYNNGRRSAPYATREAAERYSGRVGIARIVEDRRNSSRLFG